MVYYIFEYLFKSIPALIVGFLIGGVLGYSYSPSPSYQMEILVAIWFYTSSAIMFMGAVGWAIYALFKTGMELSDHYKFYKKTIENTQYKLGEAKLFTAFEELMVSDGVVPDFAKWVVYIYSWPVVLLVFVVIVFLILIGLILSELFVYVDNKIKDRMIRKNLGIALLSDSFEVRERAYRIHKRLSDKKHSR